MVQLRDAEPPLDWTSVFERPLPVELEIGCGKGLFLEAAARQRPETGFIGVEKAGKWFARAVERIWKGRTPNVRLIQGDAFDLLTRWIAPESLSGVHVYFPDPWPKKRHAKRRLLQEPLFSLSARGLRRDAHFYLASDVGPYFNQAVEAISALPFYEPIVWPQDAPDRLPTHYAVKFQREGRSLHYAKFRRTAAPYVPPAGAEPA